MSRNPATTSSVLAMAAPVHLGIGLAMGMMEFGLAMLVANLAFVPAAAFRGLGSRIFPRPHTSERLA